MAQKERLEKGCAFFICSANNRLYVRAPPPTANRRTWTNRVRVSLQKIIPHTKRCMRLFGAEGETRTLAPVSRPTPLAGAPRHQLEYFCKCNGLTDIQFAQAVGLPQPAFGGESGIRTHGTLPYDGFQDRSVITTSVSLRIGLDYHIIKTKPCQGVY